MDKPTYKLIFDGKIKPGEDLEQVKTRLSSLFRSNIAAIEHLFRGSSIVIKRGLSQQHALKYKRVFENTGALCRVVKEKAAPETSQKTRRCPKCGFEQPVGNAACLRCGIAFNRFASQSENEGFSKKVKPRTTQRAEAPEKDHDVRPQPIEREGWLSLGGGIVMTVIVMFVPFLTYILGYIAVLVHEFGHAVFGWLFGYPSLPAFDFMYGGGVTTIQNRNMWLLLLIYLFFGYIFFLFRKKRLTLIVLALTVVGYTLCAFTSLNEILILFMGHGFELLFAGIFLYRAMSGSAIIIALERPLYAFLGFFIELLNLRFAYRLMTGSAHRVDYEAAKGGGHWMDFSRIAEEYLRLNLTTVAFFFFLCCLFSPILAFLAHRYKVYWMSGLVKLLNPEPEERDRPKIPLQKSIP